MLFQGGIHSFQNWVPKFLDLITQESFIKKIKNSHPSMPNVNIERKEVTMCPRDIFLKKENFAFPKAHRGNSLSRNHMRGDSWAILEW